MTIISDNNKIEFYKFLNGDKSVADFEQFVYSQSELEQQLNHEIYLELIGFDFKHQHDKAKLSDFIKNNIIDEGQFETWMLKAVLTNFLTDPKNLHIHLEKLYHLYCGVYQNNGQRKYEFKFLANLGLNYLYWIDEGYLKTKYGDNWEIEYQKCSAHFEFYHLQLQPFATEILTAINSNEIQISNDGTYKITEDLSRKLETGKTYELKHKSG